MRPQHATLRLATAADATPIARMSRELIEAGLGWTWTRARVERNIRSPNTIAVVACDPGQPVGFAIMHFGDEHAHLNLLAVAPDRQRRGIGRQLFGWLERSALVAGIATVRLELRATNRPGRRFYEALGFSVVARVPGYYSGLEDALRMARAIGIGPRGPVPDVRALLKW